MDRWGNGPKSRSAEKFSEPFPLSPLPLHPSPICVSGKHEVAAST